MAVSNIRPMGSAGLRQPQNLRTSLNPVSSYRIFAPSGTELSVERKVSGYSGDVVKLKTGELVAKEEFDKLTPENQSYILENGVQAFNDKNKTALTAFQESNVQLSTGEYISKSDYDKLSPDNQAYLKQYGISAYNEKTDANLQEFQASNVKLDTGEWIDKNSFSSLSAENQSYLQKNGIDAYNSKIQQEFNANYVRLKNTGEYVTKESYNALSENDRTLLNKSGVEAFNEYKQKEQQKSDTQYINSIAAMNAQIKQNEATIARFPDRAAALKSQNEILRQQIAQLTGMLSSRAQTDINAIMAGQSSQVPNVVHLSDGSSVPMSVWQDMSSEQQQILMDRGIGGYNAAIQSGEIQNAMLQSWVNDLPEGSQGKIAYDYAISSGNSPEKAAQYAAQYVNALIATAQPVEAQVLDYVRSQPEGSDIKIAYNYALESGNSPEKAAQYAVNYAETMFITSPEGIQAQKVAAIIADLTTDENGGPKVVDLNEATQRLRAENIIDDTMEVTGYGGNGFTISGVKVETPQGTVLQPIIEYFDANPTKIDSGDSVSDLLALGFTLQQIADASQAYKQIIRYREQQAALDKINASMPQIDYSGKLDEVAIREAKGLSVPYYEYTMTNLALFVKNNPDGANILAKAGFDNDIVKTAEELSKLNYDNVTKQFYTESKSPSYQSYIYNYMIDNGVPESIAYQYSSTLEGLSPVNMGVMGLFRLPAGFTSLKDYISLSYDDKKAVETIAREARDNYIKQYGVDNLLLSGASQIVQPTLQAGRALSPDVTLSDITGAEWALTASQGLSYIAMGVGVGTSMISKVASTALDVAGMAAFDTYMALEWSDMGTLERILNVAINIAFAGAIFGQTRSIIKSVSKVAGLPDDALSGLSKRIDAVADAVRSGDGIKVKTAAQELKNYGKAMNKVGLYGDSVIAKADLLLDYTDDILTNSRSPKAQQLVDSIANVYNMRTAETESFVSSVHPDDAYGFYDYNTHRISLRNEDDISAALHELVHHNTGNFITQEMFDDFAISHNMASNVDDLTALDELLVMRIQSEITNGTALKLSTGYIDDIIRTLLKTHSQEEVALLVSDIGKIPLNMSWVNKTPLDDLIKQLVKTTTPNITDDLATQLDNLSTEILGRGPGTPVGVSYDPITGRFMSPQEAITKPRVKVLTSVDDIERLASDDVAAAKAHGLSNDEIARLWDTAGGDSRLFSKLIDDAVKNIIKQEKINQAFEVLNRNIGFDNTSKTVSYIETPTKISKTLPKYKGYTVEQIMRMQGKTPIQQFTGSNIKPTSAYYDIGDLNKNIIKELAAIKDNAIRASKLAAYNQWLKSQTKQELFSIEQEILPLGESEYAIIDADGLAVISVSPTVKSDYARYIELLNKTELTNAEKLELSRLEKILTATEIMAITSTEPKQQTIVSTQQLTESETATLPLTTNATETKTATQQSEKVSFRTLPSVAEDIDVIDKVVPQPTLETKLGYNMETKPLMDTLSEITPETDKISEIKTQTDVEAEPLDEIQTDVETEPLTETQTQTQTVQETFAPDIVEIETKIREYDELRKLRPLTKSEDKDYEDAKKRKKFQGALAWRQGIVWYSIKLPFVSKEESVATFYKYPPPGAKVVGGGKGSAYQSIQKYLEGQVEGDADIDLGIFTVKIRGGKVRSEPGASGAIEFIPKDDENVASDLFDGDIIIPETVAKKTANKYKIPKNIKGDNNIPQGFLV